MKKISLLAVGITLASLNGVQAACPIFTNYDDVKLMLGNAGIKAKDGKETLNLKIIKLGDSFFNQDPKQLIITGKEEEDSCYYKIALKTDKKDSQKDSHKKLGFFVLTKAESKEKENM